jgi:diguanylate cyclase (GGDEF)-like protein
VRVIRGVCDPRVQVARVGGEEFGLLITQANVTEATALAERAREAVERHAFDAPVGTLQLTASFGVAQLGAGREDGTSLFARADAMLYEAKRSGRNRVRS